MQKVQEFIPKNNRQNRTRLLRNWYSETTNITLVLDANLLRDSAQGYEIDTIQALLKDLSHDLGALKLHRSALIRSMRSKKMSKQKIAAEIARIDKKKIPLTKAFTTLQEILNEQKKNIPTWHSFFFKVAKRSLDQKTINALSDQATKLRDEALLFQSNKKPPAPTGGLV